MHISFRHIFFALGSVIAISYILYVAKSLLLPLFFALLISLILYPMVKWLMKRGFNIIWSILTNMFVVTVIIAGIIYFFSSQIVRISQDYEHFSAKLNHLYEETINFINRQGASKVLPPLESGDVETKVMETLSESGLPLVSDTLTFTGAFLSQSVLTIIYTFLILLYHKSFARALTLMAPIENRKQFYQMLKEAQKVGQQYLLGIFTLMLIIGTLNSVSLLILGIDYAIFFGFMAALLAIIPYIGTFMGGLIPTVYALMNYDSMWYPLGVVLMFWGIQIIDGNYLTPKIVGGNLHLNALTALLSLIAGGLLWGISGMILFLPLAAIFKVMCEYYGELKPIAMLMSDESVSTRTESLFAKLKRWFSKKPAHGGGQQS